jgi:PAS domain S-box-containing protein
VNLVTILWTAAASAAVLLAVVHMTVWVFGRQQHASLALAAAAVALVGVTFAELGMMESRSPEEWGRWIYWIHIPMFLLLVSVALFVRLYFRAGRLWLMWTIIAARGAILIANLLLVPNFNFESITSIRMIPFLGEQVAVLESGVTSRWQWLATLSVVLLVAYVADATWTVWRRNSQDDRRKSLIVGGGTLLFVTLSTTLTQLVLWRQLQMPILITAPYLILVLAMALELGWDTLLASALAHSLQESESRLELAANAGQLGLWTWDMRRDRVWATERARKLFGLRPADRIEIEDLRSRIHPDDYPRVRETLQKSADHQARYFAEFRVGLDDATPRWISAQGKIESDAQGQVTMVHGVLRDVSDQKKSQAEADELRREVTHSGRITMLGRLSSALAHELSQPLGAILRNVEAAEILLHRPDPNLEELRAIVSDIHKDDQRAGAIIDKLRSLLKRRQMQFQPLSVESLVNDASTLVRPDASARHVVLQCAADVSLPLVSGDRVHLSQVLINLILNGIDSICDSAGPSREVIVTAHAAESAVEITVADSGAGLTPEALSRLGEPFFTTKSSGMGMGLSVSRTIVEAHGGRLCAENQSKGGALFRVILPAIPLAAVA